MTDKAAAMKCLQSLIDRIAADEVRLTEMSYSRPVVEVPLSADGSWHRFEPSRFTTVSIVYEAKQ
jgi:hypothetical protein